MWILKKELDIQLSIVKIIQKRRLSYFSHVVRMTEKRYQGLLLYGQIKETKRKTKEKVDQQHPRRLLGGGVIIIGV